MTICKHNSASAPPVEAVAGNGLLDRRALLGRGILFAGAAATGAGASGVGGFAAATVGAAAFAW